MKGFDLQFEFEPNGLNNVNMHNISIFLNGWKQISEELVIKFEYI